MPMIFNISLRTYIHELKGKRVTNYRQKNSVSMGTLGLACFAWQYESRMTWFAIGLGYR